jgi:hypothetical protein
LFFPTPPKVSRACGPIFPIQDLIAPVDTVLQALSVPAYMLSLPGAFVTTALSVLFMLSLAGMTVATGYAATDLDASCTVARWTAASCSYSLKNSSLGAVWRLNILRAFLGVADMFYIVPLRIFLAWVSPPLALSIATRPRP